MVYSLSDILTQLMHVSCRADKYIVILEKANTERICEKREKIKRILPIYWL